MAKNKQATIIDVKEMLKPQKRTLPKSWIKAAGLLKHKKKDLEKHLKKIRSEWDRNN
jgi:hypothetical protein